MRAAPGILFVQGGREQRRQCRVENCGACAGVPNQIVVGAVNRGGDETSFTNVGAVVVVHANRRNVEVPPA